MASDELGETTYYRCNIDDFLGLDYLSLFFMELSLLSTLTGLMESLRDSIRGSTTYDCVFVLGLFSAYFISGCLYCSDSLL